MPEEERVFSYLGYFAFYFSTIVYLFGIIKTNFLSLVISLTRCLITDQG